MRSGRESTGMAIETVLLAVGPSDEGRAEALADAVIELAGPTGASVVLAHVFGDEGFHSLRASLADSGDDRIDSVAGRLDSRSVSKREADLTPDEVADRIVYVREVGDRLDDADIAYEVRGTVGADPARAITDLAETVEADRIVIGGRRRSPSGKAVFGSTAQEILLNAPCPVEFVRTD